MERIASLHPGSELCERVLSCLNLPNPPLFCPHTHTFTACFIFPHLQTDPPRSSTTYRSLFPPPQQIIMIYFVFRLNATVACRFICHDPGKVCPVIRPSWFLFKPHFHLLFLLLAFSSFLFSSFLCLSKFPLLRTYPPSSDRSSAGV